MHLKKLEIQGFKSFAHKTILEFDKGITAIVGPNGSGKSNIADAVRWAFGEQSLKMLRGKKSEDVIFSGSRTRARLGLAQVSLYLDNEDNQIPVSYPEVVITRRLYRDGESKYLLNNRPIKLMGLVELLARGGFGQKTYSVINQGMIDAILNASPFERKEMFEEAAGVKHFQLKKNRAMRKLERTRDNLRQVAALLRELRPRRDSLEKQVKRAKERKETLRELRALQKKWYLFLWQELTKKEKSLKKEEKDKKEAAFILKKVIAELEKKLAEKEKKSDVFQSEYLSLSEIVDNLHEKKGEIEVNLARIKGHLEAMTGGGTEGKNESSLQKQKKFLQEQIKKNNKAIQKSQKDLNGKLKRLNILNERLGQIQAEIGRLKEAPEKEGVDISELAEELEQVYSLQENLIERIASCEKVEDISEIEDDARRISMLLEELIEKFEEVEAQSLSRKTIRLQKELTDILTEKENLQKEANLLQVNLGIAENKKESLVTDLKSLEEALSKMTSKKEKEEETPYDNLVEKEKRLSKDLSAVKKELEEAKEKLASVSQEEEMRKSKIFDLERDFRAKRDELEKLTTELSEISIELAKFDSQKDSLKREIEETLGGEPAKEIMLGEKKALEIDKEKTADRIELLKENLLKIGSIDEGALSEFEEVDERYQFLEKESGDLKKASSDLKKAILKLDKKIAEKFERSFREIDKNFNKYFRIIFGGGQAHLRIQKYIPAGGEEEETEKKKFKSGVEIKAVPPGKKIRTLNALSGGEKALTSIAILFSIIASNPSPFVVLDEVDATLDEANSRRFAKILKNLTKKTQFIVITHNRATMHQARALYGVTMQDDGISKLLSVKLEEEKVKV